MNTETTAVFPGASLALCTVQLNVSAIGTSLPPAPLSV